MSDQHRRNVASLPCARCRIEGYSQCAHSNQSKHGKSKGMKASDFASFPLCCDRPGVLGCHSRHDQKKDYDKWEAEELEDQWIIQTLLTLARSGKLKAAK